MDSDDLVAGIVAIGATALGIAALLKDGDGTVISTVTAVWGVVLGYVFGKKAATKTPA